MVQVQANGRSAEEIGAGVTSHARTAWQGNAQSCSRFNRIAVFCGASEGTSPVYMAAAQVPHKLHPLSNMGRDRLSTGEEHRVNCTFVT